MNYRAFTNDSLTMMYEGIRGALAAGRTRDKGKSLDFAFERHLTGKITPLISRPRCLSVECFSRSSIGRKIRPRCPLSAEAGAPAGGQGRARYFLGRQAAKMRPVHALCDHKNLTASVRLPTRTPNIRQQHHRGPACRCLAGSKFACGDPIIVQIATATSEAAKIYSAAIRFGFPLALQWQPARRRIPPKLDLQDRR
jgi:hypothetical protein